MSPAPATRVPRGRRGTFATCTALIGLIASAAAATEAVSLAVDHRTLGYRAADVASFGRTTHLGDALVLAVAVAALVVGVVLVLAALVPPRRALIELTEPDPDVAAGISTRSLRRALAAAAVSVDGVDTAAVTGRRRLKVTARTTWRDTASLPERITERTTAVLTGLEPSAPRTVRVVLDRKDG